jgi:hypothetical protein
MTKEIKRLFYLKIKALHIDNKTNNYLGRSTPVPLFCHVNFNEAFTNEIQKYRELLISLNLSMISKLCHQVSCFFDITNRYHEDATIEVHITETKIFFTGSIPPYQQPYFTTSKLSITEIIESAKQFKRVELHKIKQPEQEALIKCIELKNKELELLWDEAHQLNELKEQLEKVEVTTVSFDDEALIQYQSTLKENIDKKEVLSEALESEVNLLCKQLLWRYFKILPGDWIYSEFGSYKGTPIQLVVEMISYSEGVIHISGPNITQKGELGKRGESLAIRVKSDEH